MRVRLKQVLWVALWTALVALAAVSTLAVWLALPGEPSAAGSLKFEGYILLPKGKHSGALTVLDYLTVRGNDLFVTNESSGSVYKIAIGNGALPGAADVSALELEPAAHGVAMDPVTRLAFVTRSEANTVDIFAPASMRLITRISVADDPDGIFYEPFHKIIYVANGDAKTVTLIDPATRKVVATIPLGGKPEFAAFDSQTKLFYQNLVDANSIAVLDLGKRAVLHYWPLQHCIAPHGLAIDDKRRRLFIGCGANSKLAVFDLLTHQVIAALDVGGGPDSVSFDASLGRVYVTGRSGVLSVIQQDAHTGFRILDTVSMHYGAHTLAVDPSTHRLFVGYASLFVEPRIAVFSPTKP